MIRRTLLGELPHAALDELCATATVQHYREPMLLIGTHRPADDIWLVVEGQIEIFDRQAIGPEGLIGAIGPGRWFSWTGLFMGGASPQDCFAATDTTLLCVPGAVMRDLLARHPALYPRVIVEIGGRMQLLMQLVGASIVGDPTQRLAVLLNALGSIQLRHGGPLHLSASHARLAQMLGVSRQVVGKSLETLEQRGLVRRAYGMIELLDLPGLRGFVGRAAE